MVLPRWRCTDDVSDAAQEGKCLAGQYCPVGSTSPTPCDGGKYCHRERLGVPTADCIAGWCRIYQRIYAPNPF